MVNEDITRMKLNWILELAAIIGPTLLFYFGFWNLLKEVFNFNTFWLIFSWFWSWMMARGLYLKMYGFVPEDAKNKKKSYENMTKLSNKNKKEENSFICGNCDTEVIGDPKFCPECGSEFLEEPEDDKEEQEVCSSCGTEIKKTDKFCPGCGEKLE